MSKRRELSNRRPRSVHASWSRESRQAALVAATDAMEEEILSMPPAPGRNAVMLCSQVGTLDGLPASERYELSVCVVCGTSLWVTSRLKEAMQSKGMKVLTHCIKGCKGPNRAHPS